MRTFVSEGKSWRRERMKEWLVRGWWRWQIRCLFLWSGRSYMRDEVGWATQQSKRGGDLSEMPLCLAWKFNQAVTHCLPAWLSLCLSAVCVCVFALCRWTCFRIINKEFGVSTKLALSIKKKQKSLYELGFNYSLSKQKCTIREWIRFPKEKQFRSWGERWKDAKHHNKHESHPAVASCSACASRSRRTRVNERDSFEYFCSPQNL